MRSPYSIFLIISVITTATLRAQDATPPTTKDTNRNESVVRDVYATKVIIEQGSKEVQSFTAYGSIETSSNGGSSAEYLSCVGTVYISNANLWRISVDADMTISEDATVEIEIENLTLLSNVSEGRVIPQMIFRTHLQSKGIGSYLIGKVQGMTVKVEISKAEQDAALKEQP